MTQPIATHLNASKTSAATLVRRSGSAGLAAFGRAASDGRTVMVVGDEFSLGAALRHALRPEGHVVHVRPQSDSVIEEIAHLRPAVVVINLGANPNLEAAETLIRIIRGRFASIQLILYTDANVTAVRSTLRADLVLRKASPLAFALQARCWARHA